MNGVLGRIDEITGGVGDPASCHFLPLLLISNRNSVPVLHLCVSFLGSSILSVVTPVH